MKQAIVTLSILFMPFLGGGCAFDVVHVAQIPTEFASGNSCNDSLVLARNVDIRLSGGYSRTLKQGTRWNCIGRTAQGNVYKTKDQVLTIEASNIYEAYLVVSSKKLLGFYLPVEHTFSALDNPIELVIDESPQIKGTNQ